MDSRQALGSWLSGPRAAAEEMGADFGYRGRRLGLPESGPGSVAPVGRRIAALFIDWVLCVLIAFGLISRGEPEGANLWASALFFTVSVLFLSTLGTTPGKRLMGLCVVRAGGGRATPLQVGIRSLLLLLVVPAVVWDRDTRGLHDKAAGLVQVRMGAPGQGTGQSPA